MIKGRYCRELYSRWLECRYSTSHWYWGFALNCAPERIDDYTPKQLANAYQAAEELGFKMFFSFDFAYWATGDTADIIDIVGNYSSHPAQAYYRFVVFISALCFHECSYKLDCSMWNYLHPIECFIIIKLNCRHSRKTRPTKHDNLLTRISWWCNRQHFRRW